MIIIVYGLKVCPNCNELQEALHELGVKFMYRNMETPESKTHFLMNKVFTAIAPVLEIDGKFYTFEDLFPNNELDTVYLVGLVSDQTRAIE